MRRLIPTFGILIFIILHVYAANIYPGGSPKDPNSLGYDWFNNLWCNLMSENALNGHKNPARPVSIFAVIVLGSSMIIFFFQFAKFFVKDKIVKNIIKTTGILAMVSAAFIFTKYHDFMTTILSISGLLGIISIIRTLHINKMFLFKIFGIICLIIIGLNNLFYYNEKFIDYLPLVQLIDFICILTWTIGLNLKMIIKK